MGSSELAGYCSFTKAIEHLGDRWLLLIVRELGVFGPAGFNELATSLPGRVSRSVLADRLRRLETFGLVSRGHERGVHAPYRLTTVGLGLMPTILSLRVWADTWLPDDPDMVERDPAIVLGWLAQRVVRDRAPDRSVVAEFRLRHQPDRRYWLVIQHDVEPYGCLTDPFLEPGRYVYLESAMSTLLALAKGRVEWYGRLRGRVAHRRWRSGPGEPGDRVVPRHVCARSQPRCSPDRRPFRGHREPQASENGG